MLAFLDTEFTDLDIQPWLLPVGLVTDFGENPGEFYTEVTDRGRIQRTRWFGLGAALPQFGKIADAACTYAGLGARLSALPDDLVARLQTHELVELAYGYHLDWEFVDLAISDAEINTDSKYPRSMHYVNAALQLP